LQQLIAVIGNILGFPAQSPGFEKNDAEFVVAGKELTNL